MAGCLCCTACPGRRSPSLITDVATLDRLLSSHQVRRTLVRDDFLLKSKWLAPSNSELMGFWILSIVLYSKEQHVSESISVSILR
jgi:hypothetical protein